MCRDACLACLPALFAKAEVLLHLEGTEVLGWPKKAKGEGHVARAQLDGELTRHCDLVIIQWR